MGIETIAAIETKIEQVEGVDTPPRPWPLPGRLAFRFWFCYLLIYNLPAPLTSITGFDADRLWFPLTTWVGKRFFHTTVDLTPSGSGDTTEEWLRLLCCLVVASALAVIWSVLGRRRPRYDRLYAGLRIYARYVVAFALISYGADKVIPAQFSTPSLMTLQEPIGDTSPMGLLWTFMGASSAYTVFAGSIEMVGGLLLTFRRTALLGSLVAIAALSNVVALNLCYDVPVKLYSTDLLLMSVFVALPDASRLIDFFLRGRATPAAAAPSTFRSRRMSIAVQIVKALIVIWAVASSLIGSYHARIDSRSDPRAPLYGQWNVEEWDVDGKAAPRVIGDSGQWKRLVIMGTGRAAVQDNADQWSWPVVKVGTSALTLYPEDSDSMTFAYAKSSPKELYLSGMVGDRRVQIKLRRQVERDYLLVNRGFHWINEYPFDP